LVAAKRDGVVSEGKAGRRRNLHTSFQQRDLAALLVRNREDILQFRVAVSEFVSSTLFGLYPLPSSSLLTGVSKVFYRVRYAHIVVVVRVVRSAASAAC
jgi:hypothetical protein